MEQELFDNFEKVKRSIIKQLNNYPYQGDVYDIGTEIGIIIGKLSEEEVRDFKFGLEHGISLSDGTH